MLDPISIDEAARAAFREGFSTATYSAVFGEFYRPSPLPRSIYGPFLDDPRPDGLFISTSATFLEGFKNRWNKHITAERAARLALKDPEPVEIPERRTVCGCTARERKRCDGTACGART